MHHIVADFEAENPFYFFGVNTLDFIDFTGCIIGQASGQGLQVLVHDFNTRASVETALDRDHADWQQAFAFFRKHHRRAPINDNAPLGFDAECEPLLFVPGQCFLYL